MDIISFVLGYKKGKAEGGGALTEDVCHVTFMNGDTVLYEKPVFVGDDCTDIVKKGTIGTPSKASTPQYSYTYTGWSLTNGGEASTDALAAVSGDRTVYAAYDSVLRYYTVTYLDEDGTVLKTESLAYGAMPSYTPAKEGFSFDGWEPALATVTQNATYTAKWLEKVTFAGSSWAEIARISEAGEAANYFKVGETRQIPLTSGETITVAIAGFDHDDLADGSGKAGISVVCMSVPSDTFAAIYGTETTSKYYNSTKLYSALNSETELVSYLPSELVSVIKPVSKACPGNYSSATSKYYNFTLWTLSFMELGFRTTSANRYADLGSKYDLFDSVVTDDTYASDLPTVTKAGTTTKVDYWTRQSKLIGVYNICYAKTDGNDGNVQKAQSSTEKAIRFGFCI